MIDGFKKFGKWKIDQAIKIKFVSTTGRINFVFDGVKGLFYKCHKIRLNRLRSCIDSLE